MSLFNGRMPRAHRTVRIASVVGIAILICSATPVTARTPHGTRCRGVRVAPGDNIQARIDGHQRRTRFCFARGTYRLTDTIQTGTMYPTLDLRAGAIIDGQNGSFLGIASSDAPNGTVGMRVLGGVFQHFGNEAAAEHVSAFVVRDNSVVVGTEFRENYNAGFAIQGDNARVANVNTHHNGRYGLVVTASCSTCRGPVGIVIENSEIAYNNTRRLPTGDHAGGTKFSMGTDRMVVRRNEVHHNYGSGLWWDGFNTNANVHHNAIYDNFRWGIRWELSYGGAKIHHNTLRGNGVGDGTMNYHNGQIVISNSDGSVGGIEIYENRISGVAHALTIADNTDRDIRSKRVYVHDNVMTLRGENSRVGAVASSGTELFSAEWNNRFEDNGYRVSDRGGTFWVWNGETLSWSGWQGYGNDDEGQLRAL